MYVYFLFFYFLIIFFISNQKENNNQTNDIRKKMNRFQNSYYKISCNIGDKFLFKIDDRKITIFRQFWQKYGF